MTSAFAAPACLAQDADLREFTVGMPVAALPSHGYVDLVCADQPSHALSAWTDYAACPADAHGLHGVGFRYDETMDVLARVNEDAAGTKVGGHPVVLTALIGDDAKLDGLRMATDPKARAYMHKKAFLFGLQVRAHYGDSGWNCTEQPQSAAEQPVGGVYVHERCEKDTPTRHLEVRRELFRDPAQELRAAVNASEFTVLARGGPG